MYWPLRTNSVLKTDELVWPPVRQVDLYW